MPKCTTTTTIPAFLGDGRVLLALKTAWADGTRHLLFEPLRPTTNAGSAIT